MPKQKTKFQRVVERAEKKANAVISKSTNKVDKDIVDLENKNRRKSQQATRQTFKQTTPKNR